MNLKDSIPLVTVQYHCTYAGGKPTHRKRFSFERNKILYVGKKKQPQQQIAVSSHLSSQQESAPGLILSSSSGSDSLYCRYLICCSHQSSVNNIIHELGGREGGADNNNQMEVMPWQLPCWQRCPTSHQHSFRTEDLPNVLLCNYNSSVLNLSWYGKST